jgi:transposase
MKMTLTSDEKQTLLAQHAPTRDGRVRDRIKSVIHASNGWSPSEIADALLIHETTVRQHLKDYQGSKKLKPDNGGSQSYLNQEQTEELVAYLSENTYHYNYQIVEHIKQTYDVNFSVSGLNKWLHQHGFSYKQPKGVPHKFDEEKQAAFIAHYEQLKADLGDEPILFMDATHPTQATKVSCGWIRTGEDKPVKTTGSRTRLNLLGAMNLNAIGATHVERIECVNSETIQQFLVQLRENERNNRPRHLILDSAAYHRAAAVKEKAQELNIQLHYLPPYSPNLNPIERLWKVMNEHARNNRYFATASAFRETVDNFFTNTLPTISGSLASRINDNFQVLKHAS